MTKVCACGKPATHRVLWNPWLEVVEPILSKAPSRCYDCARNDAQQATVAKRAELEREREYDDRTRRVFRSTEPVPPEWVKLARQTSKRHPEVINPGGLVKVWAQNNYLFVELYPSPELEKEHKTWLPQNALYILRYLIKRPVSFREVPRDESPSPSTWRESREQWSGTGLPPVVEPESGPSRS